MLVCQCYNPKFVHQFLSKQGLHLLDQWFLFTLALRLLAHTILNRYTRLKLYTINENFSLSWTAGNCIIPAGTYTRHRVAPSLNLEFDRTGAGSVRELESQCSDDPLV